MKHVGRFGMVILLSYVLLMVALYSFQRSLIFHPSPRGESTPSDFSIPFEEVSFSTTDHAHISGWWIPAKPSARLNISLLYCHGNGANLSMLSHVAKLFSEFGFDTLMFDYRGYGDSLRGELPLSEQGTVLDGEAALAWLQQKSSQPIIIWGHSLGSSIAAHIASRHAFAGVVLEGAFPSIATMARHRYPLAIIVPSLLLDPFDTEEYLKRINVPILFLHAEHDTIIPRVFGEKLFTQTRDPKQWTLLRNIDHNDFPNVALAYAEQIRDFARSITLKQ